MSKKYSIKANERLFEDWMRVSASPHSKLGLHGAWIVQNDMELTGQELNDWYKETGRLIETTEEHFEQVISDMKALRERSVKYIKQLNK
ncbi:hypothetical protein [Paenibacillus sp. Mc5Re-14]|uniref:hypothetical protein n=1 Tax=Paenibacillus sp. Mc5Re-14 TaxID=1030529 RepID=UPI000B840C41|nr:hypothetical protein [Paenibacillus sp. Mc5Re-14]